MSVQNDLRLVMATMLTCSLRLLAMFGIITALCLLFFGLYYLPTHVVIPIPVGMTSVGVLVGFTLLLFCTSQTLNLNDLQSVYLRRLLHWAPLVTLIFSLYLNFWLGCIIDSTDLTTPSLYSGILQVSLVIHLMGLVFSLMYYFY